MSQEDFVADTLCSMSQEDVVASELWFEHCLTPQYRGGDDDHDDDTRMEPTTGTQCPTLLRKVAGVRVCAPLHVVRHATAFGNPDPVVGGPLGWGN